MPAQRLDVELMPGCRRPLLRRDACGEHEPRATAETFAVEELARREKVARIDKGRTQPTESPLSKLMSLHISADPVSFVRKAFKSSPPSRAAIRMPQICCVVLTYSQPTGDWWGCIDISGTYIWVPERYNQEQRMRQPRWTEAGDEG